MVVARHIHVAARAVEVRAASSEIQLMPAGVFRAVDGRPEGIDGWHLDAEVASRWLAELKARQSKFVIDYEHQTLHAVDNGQPAPAAGWFTGAGLELRDGALWATDVEWTDKARAAIEAGEYRYISPVFAHDDDGTVTDLLNAALTNSPAIDGMREVLAAAASQFAQQEHPVDPKEIRKALGLAEDAKDTDVLAACQAIAKERDELKAGKADLDKQLAAANQKIEAAKQTPAKPDGAAEPDPAKYAPIEVVTDLRDQVAALTQTVTGDKVAALVNAALEDGRLLPSMQSWAEDLGKKDFAALSKYLDAAQPIAGLRDDQSGGQAPATKNEHGLTANQMAICKQLGQDPAEYAKFIDKETQA